MKTAILAVTVATAIQLNTASAQVASATDPTAGFDRLFGLGGRTCKQYDDTGRLFIYSEGLPSQGIMSWLQRSDNGTKANVPMPDELAVALPLIPGCLPGKHHAASASAQDRTRRNERSGQDAEPSAAAGVPLWSNVR